MYRYDLWDYDLPKNKIDAILSGRLYYYDGEPCEDGHIVRKYVNGMCEACVSYFEWANGHNTNTGRFWENMCKQILAAKHKFGIPIDELMPFGRREAVAYFETLFKDDMTWINYGIIWRIKRITKISKCETFEQAASLESFMPVYTSHDRQIKTRRGLYPKHPLRLVRR